LQSQANIKLGSDYCLETEKSVPEITGTLEHTWFFNQLFFLLDDLFGGFLGGFLLHWHVGSPIKSCLL